MKKCQRGLFSTYFSLCNTKLENLKTDHILQSVYIVHHGFMYHLCTGLDKHSFIISALLCSVFQQSYVAFAHMPIYYPYLLLGLRKFANEQNQSKKLK